MDRPAHSRRSLLLAALGVPLLLQSRTLLALTDCKAGETNLMGPAYRPDAPFRTSLCAPTEPGTPLRLTGAITAAGSCQRLPTAVLDVWQADAAGNYDMNSAAFRLRGRFRPDAKGRYAFDTVVPGKYGIRAQHVHFLVTCPGHEPHITQCYFTGDERVLTDRLVKAALVVEPKNARDKSRPDLLQADFGIVLQPEQRADAAARALWPEYAGTYELAPGVALTISAAGNELRWAAPPETPGDAVTGVLSPRSRTRFFCREFDITVEFVRDEHGKVKHALIQDRQVARKLS